MKRSPRPGKTLSDSLHQRLNSYALAASAAGVGALALSQPANAKVIYTAANVTIPLRTFVPLDLNHDGVNDLSFYRTSWVKGESIRVSALQTNAVAGYSTHRPHRTQAAAFAFKHRVNVGPKLGFQGGKHIVMWNLNVSSTVRSSIGQWKNVKNRYLGVRFKINGRTHYGWARLNVAAAIFKGGIATLTGYAYETVPDKPIVAGVTQGPDADQAAPASLQPVSPKPASLGALALGAPALSIWRREDSEPEGAFN
jgi:hypothetical protein